MNYKLKYCLISCFLFACATISLATTHKGKSNAHSIFVSIEGSTNINHFELTSNTVYIQQPKYDKEKSLHIDILVHDFKSPSQNITTGFRNLINANDYPNISISIDADSLYNLQDKNSWQIVSKITLAGVSQNVLMECTFEPSPHNKMIIKGNATLNLTSFNIKPPEKLLGAIKVNNRIFVNFVINIETSVQLSSCQSHGSVEPQMQITTR